MPVQTMSDDCELQNDTQFTQDHCNNIDNDKAISCASNDAILCDSVIETPLKVADFSDSNGDEHIEWDILPKTKQPSINESANEVDSLAVNVLTVIENSVSCVEEVDEFCDFESYAELDVNLSNCTNNNEVEFANFASNTTEFENFANFESSTWNNVDGSPNCSNDGLSDEEFADFKSAINDKSGNQSVQSNKVEHDDPDKDWTALFKATFTIDQLLESNNLDLCDTSANIFDHASSQGQMLWTNLQEMDLKSICLHNWKESLSFKRILQALKMDKNIVQHDIFPYSYNYNHVLEPMLVSNLNSHAPDNSKTNSMEFSDKLKTNEPNSISDNEFPPVFSLNQDLDFFESKYSYKNNTQNNKDDLISEFENNNELLDPEIELSKQASSSSSPASSVNDLRKMLKNSIAKSNNEQVLSAEALQILTELPNLSFVRAKVLMFPINDKGS